MAAVANLILLNNAGANVTYYPQKVTTGDYAQYVDRTSAVIAAQSKASLTYKESTTTRKVQGKVTFPVLNATTGLVSHTLLGTFEIVIPLVATATERLDVRKRLASFVGHAVVNVAADDGEMPWG